MTPGCAQAHGGDGGVGASGPIHRVDLWRYPLDVATDELARLRDFLSDGELQRAARLIQPGHGDRFIAARGRLRQILSGYAGCEPRALSFEVSETGKPYLGSRRASDDPLHFNLTHSGDMAAAAVCRTAQVGIDIEKVRAVQEGLARRYFAPEETTQIEALPDAMRLDAFFRCWTRKEAFVKATGEGIRRGLDSFIVSVGAHEPARVISIDGDDEAGRAFGLRRFDPGEGYEGAVCVANGGADSSADFTLKEIR